MEPKLEETVPAVPSLAQTHMQGPLAINGSGKSLTKEELDAVKEDLAKIKAEFGLKEPKRAFMNEPDTEWRFGGPPDYSLTNYMYLKGRTICHPEGSLELIVENLIKTWEMERSHKPDYTKHHSVDQEQFCLSANGGRIFNNAEANQVGNYNVLLNACPAELYDAENTTWEESHDKFHTAFSAFPWEILEVYSPPPKVAFTWRHWGHFSGTYDEHQGKGELVEMYGFGTAIVNETLQLCSVEVYYNAQEFVSVMKGLKNAKETNRPWRDGCPHLEMLQKSKSSSSSS
jgi:hypothetical protein